MKYYKRILILLYVVLFASCAKDSIVKDNCASLTNCTGIQLPEGAMVLNNDVEDDRGIAKRWILLSSKQISLDRKKAVQIRVVTAVEVLRANLRDKKIGLPRQQSAYCLDYEFGGHLVEVMELNTSNGYYYVVDFFLKKSG